jgi:hypothetical protein
MAGRAKENLPGGSLKYQFEYLKICIFKWFRCTYRIILYDMISYYIILYYVFCQKKHIIVYYVMCV